MSIQLPTFGKAPDREEIIKNDPLGEFLVWWLDPAQKVLDEYQQCLETARNEQHLQDFLAKHPILLARQLGGGQGRWVIPQQRLGAEHVTDFVIGEGSSLGHEWYAVELESPTAKMFTKSGDPTARLNHAIRQILDWRAWLQRNQNYASRRRTEGGLGLTDIVADLPGLILIGRRSDIPDSTKELRRQMAIDLNIKIHSYDFLAGPDRGMIAA